MISKKSGLLLILLSAFLIIPMVSSATLTIYTEFGRDYGIVIMDSSTRESIKAETVSAPPSGKVDITFDTSSTKIDVGITTFRNNEKQDFKRYDGKSTAEPMIIDLTNGAYIEAQKALENAATAANTAAQTTTTQNTSNSSTSTDSNTTAVSTPTIDKTLSNIAGFAIEDTNPSSISKYKWWIIGIIVLLIIAALVFFFIRKNKRNSPFYSYQTNHHQQFAVRHANPALKKEIHHAEKQIQSAMSQLKQIQDRESQMREARKKFEEARKELERVQRNW